jgi:pimeloyl-ACP methyl ester carboxylesterase
MRKRLLLCWVLLLAAGTLPAQPGGRRPGDQAEARYREARQAFEAFEKAHGHFVQTGNGRMHYLTWGPPAGIPFLWAHGSLTNAYEMQTIADSLAAAGLYVIAIDYYGHGQTPIPPHEVSLYHVADDMKSLLDGLGIAKAVVGGFSRGGFIATAFYDAYPDRVLGLVLEDGGSVATNTHYHTLSAAELEARVVAFEKERPVERTYATEREAYEAIRDPGSPGTEFELLAWIRQEANGRWAVSPGLFKLFNLENPGQFLDNILRPTKVPLFAASMSLIEPRIIFRNLSVPLLILDAAGPNDPFPFTEANRALQRQHPRLITHRLYPDADHNIHHANPRQMTRDVIRFIGQVKEHHRLR